MVPAPEQGLSEFIWRTPYRDPDARPAELETGDTLKWVANAVAPIERQPALWAARSYADALWRAWQATQAAVPPPFIEHPGGLAQQPLLMQAALQRESG